VAHDVFVSYSQHDKPQADAVCATLEAKGFRCWIAPRDVVPGREWADAIVDAIHASRVMVLVFSSHANTSPQVRREVQIAVSAETVLIPFRIEDVAPAQSLEYYLGTPHWLDALTIPLEAHLESLAVAVGSFLAADTTTTVPPIHLLSTPARAPWYRRLSRRSLAVLSAVGAVAVALAALAAYLLWPPPASRQVVLLSGIDYLHGVAVDSAGNVYVTDHDGNRVLKLAAGSTNPTPLPFTGLQGPSGVAVDSVGAVYVTDSDHSRVLKLAAGSNSAATLPFTGLLHPRGVAVDGAGDVYVADHDNHRVLKLAAGSRSAVTLPFTGLNGPAGVAVNGSGGVYVTDEVTLRVYELYDLGGLNHQTDEQFTDLSGPHGVAVDGAGNVYVTDASNRVLKLAGGAITELPFSGLDNPGGVAVDSGGGVYVANWGKGNVLKLRPA
jgi:DNA-binding beta-propeller fold protein YncE